VLTADGSASQQVVYRRGDTLSPQVNLAEPLVTQDQHFIDCIRTGRQPCSDGSSGLGVVQAVEAAELSVREQRPVALAEVGARQPAQMVGEGAA
jgi:predicted dehydrogenase